MPNRILKESVCTSETLDALTPEEERLFYRLLVQADDFGRFDARPQIVRAKCFPLKTDAISVEQVSRWLERLAEVGLIRLYTADGKPYLEFVTWEKHQQKRARKSKYPAPPPSPNQPPPMPSCDSIYNQPQPLDNNCNQVVANVPENRESRIENRETMTRNENRMRIRARTEMNHCCCRRRSSKYSKRSLRPESLRLPASRWRASCTG